jgi:hypothetical protein
MIRQQALQWLSQNYDKEEAVFLTKELTRQGDIPIETVKNILDWCRIFPGNEDALWRLTRLGRHLLTEEVAEDVIITSEELLNLHLSPDENISVEVSGQIATLLSYLIGAPRMRSELLRSRVDALLLRWLRHSVSYGEDPKPHYNIQRRSYVQRIADLLDSGDLNVVQDRDALERFMRWVNNWESAQKAAVLPTIEFLARRYPAAGLWDIVKFD